MTLRATFCPSSMRPRSFRVALGGPDRQGRPAVYDVAADEPPAGLQTACAGLGPGGAGPGLARRHVRGSRNRRGDAPGHEDASARPLRIRAAASAREPEDLPPM